ncbi:MAG TPA: peptidoglycan DD-metalloendopeptidase family protein [Firmicutes bacterium]|nr:peptidoglycan DD-metalloendopeptidase family protein [Bacillota bacterium]
MQKKLFALLLVLVMLCAGMWPAGATTIEEKIDELEGVKKDISQRKEELAQNKKEQEKVLQEIKLLEKEIAVIEAEIRSLNQKITATEEEIAQVEAELAAAEEKLAQLDEILAVRLRAIHEHGTVSYLEVLFSSTSFTDFLSRFGNLQQVIKQDKALLTEWQQERDRIEQLRISLEERRQELLTMRRGTLEKRRQSEMKRAHQEQLIAALREDYEKTNEAISKMEEEAEKLTELIKKMQEASKGARGTGELYWPVPEYGMAWITSGYGYRRDPITGKQGVFHGGIDIGIPRIRWPGASNYNGNPVQVIAADSGIAYTYKMGSGYGNLVIIDHGNGISTVYAHNHNFLIANGQAVYRGQAIAIVGSTGYSTGPHLHFEVRVNGERVNPLGYVR